MRVVLLFLATLPLYAQRPRTIRPPAVPAQYQQLYTYLDVQLAGLDRYLDTQSIPASGAVLYGAELSPANGNRGTDLLRSDTLAGVRIYLDALQRLGINLANISIVYPLFEPSYPRSVEYIAFYRAVAAEVRRRGMKLAVGVGPAFVGTPFATIDFDFSKLTLDQYREGKANTARIILREMSPDFLGLGSEPDTEAALTGFRTLNDPVTWAAFVSSIVSTLDRGATHVGAGVGTWLDLRYGDRALEDARRLHRSPHLSGLDAAAAERGLRLRHRPSRGQRRHDR